MYSLVCDHISFPQVLFPKCVLIDFENSWKSQNKCHYSLAYLLCGKSFLMTTIHIHLLAESTCLICIKRRINSCQSLVYISNSREVLLRTDSSHLTKLENKMTEILTELLYLLHLFIVVQLNAENGL